MIPLKRNDNFIIMKINNDTNKKIFNKIWNNRILKQRNKFLTSFGEFMWKALDEEYGEDYGKSDWTDEWSL